VLLRGLIMTRRKTDLSPRQKQVLALIAKGFTAKEIGARLGCDRRTAEAHTAAIYQWIGVGSRAEATVEAVLRGLV
jgi:DNA-binding CsgD family transcriptional regulator